MTTHQDGFGETMWERAQRAAEARRREEGVEPGTLARLSNLPFVTAENPPPPPREDLAREEAVRRANNEYLREIAISARDAAARDLWMGGLIFAIGVVVTGVSYAMAMEAGGGKYVFAGGALIVGAIRLVRGLIGWTKAPPLVEE
jgi:hypothetical protein